MSGFQVVALVVLGALFVITLVAMFGGRIGRRVGSFWSAVWLFAGLTIARPGATSLAAKTLGIGRGADLVLYSFCVLVLVGFFMTYARLRRLNAEITLLVRHLALQDPKWPSSAEHGKGKSSGG